MTRLSRDLLSTSLEVALAMAPTPVMNRLSDDDRRVQDRARLALAEHLAERLFGLLDELDDRRSGDEPGLLFGEGSAAPT